jgi:hypothetical protein
MSSDLEAHSLDVVVEYAAIRWTERVREVGLADLCKRFDRQVQRSPTALR